MKIRGITVGTPIKPEKAIVRCDDMTEAEKEVARQNIGAVACLVVTTIEGLTNHTSTEIYDHIRKGGVAYLYYGGKYVPIIASANYAFAYEISDEGHIDYYEIDGKSLTLVNHKFASESWVRELSNDIGDIETALDAIIAIQNSLISIISFTIDGTPYNAIPGMTWEQWCASEYNTIGAYLVENGFVMSDIGGIYTGYGSDETPQYGDTVIVDGCEYYGM